MSRSPSARYGVAIIAILAAFAVRYGLHGTLENRIPFAFFTLATLIASWYGGLCPGVVSAGGGGTPPAHPFFPPAFPGGRVWWGRCRSLGRSLAPTQRPPR